MGRPGCPVGLTGRVVLGLEVCLRAMRRKVSSTSSGVKVSSDGLRRNMFTNCLSEGHREEGMKGYEAKRRECRWGDVWPYLHR
jgi:hypothetical protein